VDGENGILEYRGYPIEVLAEKSTHIETAYLLLIGRLPTVSELADFEEQVISAMEIPMDLVRTIRGWDNAHPMRHMALIYNTLAAMWDNEGTLSDEKFLPVAARIIGTITGAMAFCHFRAVEDFPVPPDHSLGYAANLLAMMGSYSGRVDEVSARTLDLMLLLHAEHEQNASTSTVRLTRSAYPTSTLAGCLGALANGVNVLAGPLHGGANEEVIKMLDTLHRSGSDVDRFVEDMVKDRGKFMGFGHRIYKVKDPRAKQCQVVCQKLLDAPGRPDPLLDLAQRLEVAVTSHSALAKKNLYPNVDFYSGLAYRRLGFETDFFTPLFGIARTVGWLAHWKEQGASTKIWRPRQAYVGPRGLQYRSIVER
jgi:citrate synthase